MFCTEGYVFQVHVCTRTTPHADFKPILRIKKPLAFLHKANILNALAFFKNVVSLLLDFLGPSEWPLFLCGPFLMGPAQRELVGVKAPSLLPTPRKLAQPMRPIFQSQFREFADSLDASVSAAVLGGD